MPNYATGELLEVQGEVSAAKHACFERANLLRKLRADDCAGGESDRANRHVYEKY